MSARTERRKAVKTGIPNIITKESLINMASKNESINDLMAMLNESRYMSLILFAAFENQFITEKQMMETEDIYTVPMFSGLFKEDDLLVADYVVDIYSRFKLSTAAAKRGDLLLAFLIDNDDELYQYIKKFNPDADMDGENTVFANLYIDAIKNTQNKLNDMYFLSKFEQ